MKNKINIAELLKDCPKGMELDCTMIDNVVFEKLDVRSSHHPIIIRRTDSKDLNTTIHLTKYGQYSDEEDYKCVIYPKGKTTWEGFVPPFSFNDGDIVATDDGWIGITTGGKIGEFIPTYCVIKHVDEFEAYLDRKETWMFHRLATEEEKSKLFDAIKSHGYKWNANTNTLEKAYKDMSDLKNYGTATIKYIQENGSRDMELIIPYNQEIVNIDGRYILRDKTPQYPKTYEECCEVLGADPSRIIVPSNCQDMTHEENKLYSAMYYIYQLLTCRNAYWKIAGEQICGNGTLKHCIIVKSDITLKTKICSTHFKLVFPTAEMRDKFYENFKNLIDKCKELL